MSSSTRTPSWTRMLSSTRTLRWVLAISAMLLVGVVLGFVMYAHYRAQRFLTGLPGKLGVDIREETNGFTYSQSVGGKTVFTVHAAKELQRKDGKITLHDVGIVLYGRGMGGTDQADRIHGNEFEYDQRAGVLRAAGEVYLDLAVPADKGEAAGVGGEARMIHVKTSGLVFRQKERTAVTDEAIEFSAGGFSGKAVGASYDSGAGVVVLRSAVRVNGLRAERPVALTATRAELDRSGDVARLEGAQYVSAAAGGIEKMGAERALVFLTAEGTPRRVEAEGAVTLSGEGRGSVSGGRLELELSETGQPRAGHMFGGVRFVSEDAARQERGQSREARVVFDEQGRPVHAVMTGEVEAEEKAGSSERLLRTAKLELALGGGGKQRLVLRGAAASGGAMGASEARLRMVDRATKGEGSSVTQIMASVLVARFGMGSRAEGLDGRGATSVERTALNDSGEITSKEQSTGDALKVDFGADAKGRIVMTQASQRGNVNVMRTAAAKAKSATEAERARAGEVVFDAVHDRMTLSESVQIADAESALFADRVEMDRKSGDSIATGAVKVSYQEAGGQQREPVHVTAGRAVSRRATGVTEFFAAGGGKARMWQGGSQVEAAVIAVNQRSRELSARGATSEEVDAVRAILAGSPGVGSKAAGKAEGSGAVRVVSDEMMYSGGSREVEFHRHVRVEGANGTMRAENATVLLVPAGSGLGREGAGAAEELMSSRVERVVAEGAVEIEQPGRKATGQKLTYTAADQTFVLLGTKEVPPRLVDESRGTITGRSLRFRSGDDSVVVSGKEGDGSTGIEGGRVRSESRTKEKD